MESLSCSANGQMQVFQCTGGLVLVVVQLSWQEIISACKTAMRNGHLGWAFWFCIAPAGAGSSRPCRLKKPSSWKAAGTLSAWEEEYCQHCSASQSKKRHNYLDASSISARPAVRSVL